MAKILDFTRNQSLALVSNFEAFWNFAIDLNLEEILPNRASLEFHELALISNVISSLQSTIFS